MFHLKCVQRTPAAADYYVFNLVLQHFETLKHYRRPEFLLFVLKRHDRNRLLKNKVHKFQLRYLLRNVLYFQQRLLQMSFIFKYLKWHLKIAKFNIFKKSINTIPVQNKKVLNKNILTFFHDVFSG